MNQHYRRSRRDDGRAKNFTRVNKNRVHCPGADEAMAFDFPACVQEQGDKAFAFRIEVGMRCDVRVPVFNNFLRRVALQ